MSRGEKTSLAAAVFGVGLAIASTALSVAGVDMSGAALWLMGGFGLVLMLGGLAGGVVSWRARDRELPVDRLREALTRGMALRTTLLLEDRGHWEDLVLPDPTPISEYPLYVWARETYDLLREHFPAHADDFYGDDPGLGAEHFALPYSVEVRRGSREAYLERRIAVLRDAAKP